MPKAPRGNFPSACVTSASNTARRAWPETETVHVQKMSDDYDIHCRLWGPEKGSDVLVVLHGAADPLVPLAAGVDTAANIQGSRLEVVPGMGHDFPPSLMATLATRVAAHCRAAQPEATA